MRYHTNHYLVAFHSIPGIGSKRLAKILYGFKRCEDAWSASPGDFIMAGIEPAVAEQLVRERAKIDLAGLAQKLNDQGIAAVCITDSDYPPLLKNMAYPPTLLYRRGLFHDRPRLAVVGTRKISAYGQTVCQRLVPDLAQRGVTIVSGLAFGVDSAAHTAALNADGITWAVLASGLDMEHVFPRSQTRLARHILSSGGCLISEYPPGTNALKQHFPLRNRIIAGLCLGTLVIEAPLSSGALITAFAALENNREVFAVPGDIVRLTSQGTNKLIQLGAIPVTDAADILTALRLNSDKPQQKALEDRKSVV